MLSASLLRRALQYAATTGRVLSLHCEDTSLSRAADMHEGAVCARLGLVGYPAIAESTMIARDLRIARYESRPLHICHLHVGESVEEVRLARSWGVDVSAEASPHHLLLTDEEVLSLDAALQDEPAAGRRAAPAGAHRGPARRHDRLHRDRPRAAPPGREGGAVPGRRTA